MPRPTNTETFFQCRTWARREDPRSNWQGNALFETVLPWSWKTWIGVTRCISSTSLLSAKRVVACCLAPWGWRNPGRCQKGEQFSLGTHQIPYLFRDLWLFLKKWKLPESFHAWMYMINIKISISIFLGSAIVEPIPTDLNRLYQPEGLLTHLLFLSHVNVQILLLEGRRIAGVRQVYDRTDRRRVYFRQAEFAWLLGIATASGLRISKTWAAHTWQEAVSTERVAYSKYFSFAIWHSKKKIIGNSDPCNRSHCFWWNIQLPAD